MSGWIKLHRDIQSHWIYNFDAPDKSLAWIDLIFLASHSGGSFMAKGKLVEFSRGQIAISQISLQKRWKMSQNKVKRFLELLKKHSMIDFETNELTTIITICNYSSFQDNERLVERPVERPVERATNDHSNDIKRMKEDKECKEVISLGAKAPEKERKKFIAPTLEEVKEFCQAEHLKMNPEKFFYHYEANGWKSGRAQIKNWKMACKGWASRDYDKPAQKQEVRFGEWLGDEVFEGDLPITKLIQVN